MIFPIQIKFYVQTYFLILRHITVHSSDAVSLFALRRILGWHHERLVYKSCL
jgi:hypothetical protein